MKKLSAVVLSLTFGSCLTVVTASAQQAPVNLGSNSNFAVLAGTTVTVTGGGTIGGNIGIFPSTAFVPGNPPVTVNGTVYSGGPVAAQAQADLTTAFNDAAGRTVGPVTVAGNIGGQTLAPGLYKSTSSLAISSGDLTLDAQGNANAVWIFQIASTLTTTSGRQVILAGGANAANIFWQVGSSATIGTTSVFHGNILAAISISMLTGSTLAGRALAMGGGVSIDTGGGSSATVPGGASGGPGGPTAPVVVFSLPANGATGVAIGSALSATFSTAMNPATITTSTFSLRQGATPVSGNVSYAGTTATFAPFSSLLPGTAYTATITTGATDVAGNALASNYVWTFTTAATPDTTRPTVVSSLPASGGTGVPIGNTFSATFSKPMDPATITSATFTLQRAGTPVAGSVSYNGTTAIFTPLSSLAPGTAYTATITTGAKDLAGNALASNYVWNITTAATATAPPFISLASTVNDASFVSPVAAGSIAAVFGTNLAMGQASSLVPSPLPLTLSQSSFEIGGRAAPLFFAMPTQVNLQIPWELAGQNQTTITATVNSVRSNTQDVPLAPFAPGIFSMNMTGAGQGAVLIAATAQLAAPGSAAPRGGYVSIFCTGLGAVTNQPATGIAAPAVPLSLTTTAPSVIIGGVAAALQFSGLAPGFAGLYQVNAQVPLNVSAGNAVPVSISVGGVASNTVTIAVQ